MARRGRSNDWGFPRWGGYGSSTREAATVRKCDRHGCEEPGDCPAPKSPNRPERWYFCQKHAAEYNARWDYFAGLTEQEAEERESTENKQSSAYRESAYYGWVGSGDGSRSVDEMRALDVLGLDPHASFDDIKRAWRTKAKAVHPDLRPGDAEAARSFHAIQLAYEILRAAEERREWKG